MKRLFLSVLLNFIVCFTYIFAQSQSGCTSTPIQNWFQAWYYVNDNEPVATITGTITKTIHLNTGGLFDDGDWCIFIKPDNPRFAKNRSGNVNANGEIELEIQTRGKPDDLAALFPIGTRVEAYGDWVEDSGHGRKTELHPVYSIRSINKNPTVVFMGQDDSGRFINSLNLNYGSFDLPLNCYVSQVTPGNSPPSRTIIVQENGKVAHGTSTGNISPENFTSRGFLDSWWFSDCDMVGRVIYGDAPYYITNIDKSIGSILNESMQYSTSTFVSTGVKSADIKVEIEAIPPPGKTISEVEWTFESSAGIIGTTYVRQTSPPYKLEFSMPYCPAEEYYQNQWLVTFSASSTPFNSRQPSVSQDFAQSFERTFYTEKRLYVLPKSQISFNIEKKGGMCGEANYITLNKSKLLPEIKLRKVKWFIETIKDENGFIIDNPIEIEVTPNTPYTTNGFSARTYTVTTNRPEERLDVIYKDLSSGEPNLTLISVTAKAVTEIGENISTSTTLSPLCGVGGYTYSQIRDAFYKMLQLRRYKMVELYDLKISRRDKIWFTAFSMYLNGERISDKQQQLIVSTIKKVENRKLNNKREVKPIRKSNIN